MPINGPGPGRPAGAKNKNTAEIKDMILHALEHKGGWRYLARQADENPVAFLGLLGKIMPLQVNGSGNVLLIEQLCVVANREWQEERKRLTQPVIEAEAVEVTPQAESSANGWQPVTEASVSAVSSEKPSTGQRSGQSKRRAKGSFRAGAEPVSQKEALRIVRERARRKRKPMTEAQRANLAKGWEKRRAQRAVVTDRMLKTTSSS